MDAKRLYKIATANSPKQKEMEGCLKRIQTEIEEVSANGFYTRQFHFYEDTLKYIDVYLLSDAIEKYFRDSDFVIKQTIYDEYQTYRVVLNVLVSW